MTSVSSLDYVIIVNNPNVTANSSGAGTLDSGLGTTGQNSMALACFTGDCSSGVYVYTSVLMLVQFILGLLVIVCCCTGWA